MHLGAASAWGCTSGCVHTQLCRCSMSGGGRAGPLLGGLLLQGSRTPSGFNFSQELLSGTCCLPPACQGGGGEWVSGGLADWKGLKGSP